jgi:hypothetical protein
LESKPIEFLKQKKNLLINLNKQIGKSGMVGERKLTIVIVFNNHQAI